MDEGRIDVNEVDENLCYSTTLLYLTRLVTMASKTRVPVLVLVLVP